MKNVTRKIKNLTIEGVYKLDGDYLIGKTTTLKLGQRQGRLKKGYSKRFIGHIDPTKSGKEAYTYISGLYAKHCSGNTFRMEHAGVYYKLQIIGLDRVEIKPERRKMPVLEYKKPTHERQNS